MSRQTVFNTQWLDDDEFKSWIKPSKRENQANCKLCRKDIELSNMGRQSLVSHALGKKHKELDLKVKSFFKPKVIKAKDITVIAPEEESSSSQTQSTLELTVTNSEKTKAEIIWAIKTVTAGYSNNSSAQISSVFQNMFPDSKIARSFQLGPDKLRYMVNFGIAPYFKSLLVKRLNETDCYVISFDESLNDMTQSCEMDLLIRYFDCSDDEVKTRFYDSQFFGHGTAKDLQKQFCDALKNLDDNKLFQISMDGPNVNLKFLQTVKNDRDQNEQHQLIDIGSCGLHTMHGAFKTGAEKTNWKIKDTLKAAFQIFHASPARREDYVTHTGGSSVYPLFFCATRWIEDKPVAERLVEIWPNILKIYAFWQTLPKSKRPSSKSYENLHAAVKDSFTIPKLNFFSYVAGIFKPFLVQYQSDNPMVPFLYNDLLNLTKKIMLLVIKPEVVHNCSTFSELTKIDLHDKTIFLKSKDMNIGFAAKQSISDLKKADDVTSTQTAAYYNDAIIFITSILSKIFQRSPLGSVVVRCSSVFDPNQVAVEGIELLECKLKRLLSHFMKLRILTSAMCDQALTEFSDFVQEVRSLYLNDFKCFDHTKTRLDNFYFQNFDIRRYKRLCSVLKIILTLSHGQAAVERGFSINNSVLKVNIKEDSIVAKKIIRDHMLANALNPHNVQISNKLILSCNTAHMRYRESKEEKAKANKNQKINEEKRSLNEELNSFQRRRDALKKTCETLDAEFVAAVKKAEEKSDINIIVKANAIKRRCEEKQADILNLEKQIGVLELKRKKIE